MVDPTFWGVLITVLAANSGLWRVMDHWVISRDCGGKKCAKTLATAMLNVSSKKN